MPKVYCKWRAFQVSLKFRVSIQIIVKNTDNCGWKTDKKSRQLWKKTNYTILLIFVFKLPFIDCILSEIVGFDQLWTAFQQKLVTTNRKLFSSKCSTFFVSLSSKTVIIFYCYNSRSSVAESGLVMAFNHKDKPLRCPSLNISFEVF